MRDNTFLAWERRPSRKITRLQDVLTERRAVSSIDCVVRVERHLGLELDSASFPRVGNRYIEKDDLRVGYDNYRLEVVVNGDSSHLLRNPLLLVALHVAYPDTIPYIGADGKLHQEPLSLTLRPEDPDLVTFYSRSQTAAALRELKRLMRRTHNLWSVREDLPQQTYEIPDVDGFVRSVEKQETELGYDEADPHSTKYAFPGSRLQSYSPTRGFSTVEDPVIASLMGIKRLVRAA